MLAFGYLNAIIIVRKPRHAAELILRNNVMLVGLLIVTSFLASSLYYYVEAVKNAMGKKRWLLGGMIMGPMLLPMFAISKRVQLRKTIGFNSCYLRP